MCIEPADQCRDFCLGIAVPLFKVDGSVTLSFYRKDPREPRNLTGAMTYVSAQPDPGARMECRNRRSILWPESRAVHGPQGMEGRVIYGETSTHTVPMVGNFIPGRDTYGPFILMNERDVRIRNSGQAARGFCKVLFASCQCAGSTTIVPVMRGCKEQKYS